MEMVKLLKFVGWLIGILLVLMLALVVLVPLFFDPNDHKDRIIAEVKEATGRDLNIGGDINLSLFPWLGLELNDLSLSNPPEFGDQPFAAVDLANVRVKLMPLLLHRTMEADTVQIQGLDLYLAKSEKGQTNWEDLARRAPQAAAAETDTEQAPAAKGFAAFSIGGVAIQDARVTWDDRSTGQHYEIHQLQLKTGPLILGEPVDVALELRVQSQKPRLQGDFELTGQLRSKPEQHYVEVIGLRVKLKVNGEGLPEAGLEAAIGANVYVDLDSGNLDAKEVELTSGELVLQAALRGDDLHSNPVFTGNLKLKPFSPRDWLERFDIRVPETKDPEVLQRLSLSSDFKATPKQVGFEALKLQLDDTRLKGAVELIGLEDPTYAFTLDIDQIDLDRYLPPVAEAKGTPEQTEASAGSTPAAPSEAPLFPVELIRQLNLDGSLRIGSLTLNQITAKAIQLKVVAKDGKLQLDEQVGRFYDGMIKGGITLNAQGKTPQLRISQEAKEIVIGPLFKDLTDEDKLDGMGAFSADLSSSGQTLNQLKRGLNGNFRFEFTDGAVKGFNLAKMLRNARAKLAGETVAVSNEPEQTDFSEMSGSAVITNGVLNNRDLFAKSPFLRVDGAGKVNLVTEQLDYTIRPVLVSTPTGQGGEELEELVGIPVPVHLEGPWMKPNWKIDLAQVLQEHQKKQLKQKVEEKVQEQLPELQEKLPDDLKDKLPGAIKGLF
jgi:AsmA protein